MAKNLDFLVKGTQAKIISTSNCIFCGEEFIVTDLEKKILDKQGFKNPEHCHFCNFKLLYSYINDRNLYHRIDPKTGKKMISIYSPDFKGTVISVEDYKKLVLDDGGLEFGKEIGDNVFDNFLNIYNNFPKQTRLVYPGLENSEYASHTGRAKNVYMSYCVFTDCEDIYFSLRIIGGCHNIFSSTNITKGTNIYFSNNIGGSHNIFFGNNMYNCSNLLFCEYMINCSECIFCCNKVNSKYMIFNKQYSKKEYEEIKKDIYKRINSIEQFKFLKEKYKEFLKEHLVEPLRNTNRCENVVGENTYDSKNSINTFSCSGLENCVNVLTLGGKSNDHLLNVISSLEGGDNGENIIGTCSFGPNIYNVFFSFGVVENSKNIYYSYDIESSEEIMFSVGLKSKKYCILNKQYTKEKYFELKKEIIEKLKRDNKRGDLLPVYMANFPYNDTVAFDLFKINKVIDKTGKITIIDKKANGTVTLLGNDFISDAELDLGTGKKFKIKWRTRDKDINTPLGIEVIKAKDLPSIYEVGEDILNKAVECEETGRLFKIVKKELNFLKNNNLPLPTMHNESRINKLINIRPTGKFYVGVCDKCEKESLTVHKKKPNHKLYCDSCYKDYMYK